MISSRPWEQQQESEKLDRVSKHENALLVVLDAATCLRAMVMVRSKRTDLCIVVDSA